MTFAELIADVQSVVQDRSWTETAIKSLLNRALLVVASGVILPGKYQLSPPLPDLYATDTITTELSSGICDLPLAFNRDLVQVINSNSEEIPIVPSFIKFLKSNPEQNSGSVRTVARQGARLLYRDIPSTTETLTVHFYEAPTAMIADGSEPDCIPVQLHRPLLVGYACAQIFNGIEDGIEGQKVNTAFWNNEFQQGLVDLEIVVGIDGSADYYDNTVDYC